MTSKKSKTALKHLTVGLIFAENICNWFYDEEKKMVYDEGKNPKTNLLLTLLEI